MTNDTHQPDYVIKKKRSSSWYWGVSAICAVVLLGAMALGYWMNQRQHVFSETVKEQFAELQTQLDEATSQTVHWQQQYQVEHEIMLQQQANYKKLQSQYANVLKERTALQRIFDPNSVVKGLQVASFIWEPTQQNTFDYRLVLIQAKKQDKVLKGSVTVTVAGEENGEVKEYDFSDIASLDSKAASFSFKYSTTLSGTFVLPEAFDAKYIRVIASITGRNPQSITQDYAWPTADQ